MNFPRSVARKIRHEHGDMTGGRGDVAAAVLQNKVIAAIVNVTARAFVIFIKVAAV